MNDDQRKLLAQIECEKSKANPDKRMLRKLVARLVGYDARTVKRGNDPGGRSRSAAFGAWQKDDET